MRKTSHNIVLSIGVLLLICAAVWAERVRASTISATVKIGLCGDGIVDSGEQCDGSALNGASCTTLGFGGGALTCYPACDFDASACTEAVSDTAGSSSGGGAVPVAAPSTSASFSGVAYSGSTVTLLKDAQLAASAVAGNDGLFYINTESLSQGNYLFSMYSTGAYGLKSPLYSIPLAVVQNESTHAQDIYLAPTIGVDKAEVLQGEDVTIFGTSAPGSEVTIVFEGSEQEVSEQNDLDGTFIRTISTRAFTRGMHTARAYYVLHGKMSPVSKTISFFVGDRNVPAVLVPKPPVRGDLNADGVVNLVDFSIMAYWYRRASPPAAVDMNNDGTINLIDLSILAFHWTG